MRFDVDLLLDSSGVPGGVLAVRLFAPAASGGARYADGAPVLSSHPAAPAPCARNGIAVQVEARVPARG